MSDNGSGWRRVEKTLLDALAIDARLSGADFRALALALRMEHEPGALVVMSAGYIAKGCSMSRRAAEKALSRLRALGYLLPAGCDQKTKSLSYTISAEPTEQPCGTEQSFGGVPNNRTVCIPNNRSDNRRQLQKTTKKTARAADQDAAADRILEAYAAVKPARLDHSRSRARSHLRKLLKAHPESDLLEAVRNYGRACGDAETAEQYRRNSGNFFSTRDGDFSGFLPGAYRQEETTPSATVKTTAHLVPEY